jgi:hypothetical protein
MMTPKEIAKHITKVAEGKVGWTKAPCELWIEREINEFVLSTLTHDKVREAAEKVCCDNQEMTGQELKQNK